jgi:hypothetical protein
LVDEHPATKIPIEWVIDIADESNGWFYGTAYAYDDEENLLHVMVPTPSSSSPNSPLLYSSPYSLFMSGCREVSPHTLEYTP